jgi:sec-independent protein translocase protein TatB
MFDISWTEFLLIGIVALIVIGPKELPGVMRTLGQYTRKIRSMAADFQNQFQEAMREAEMADLKKQVDDLAHDVKAYDPLKTVREDVGNIGKNIDKDFDKKPLELMTEQKPVETNAGEPSTAVPGATVDAVAPAASAPQTPPEPVTVTPESTERTG